MRSHVFAVAVKLDENSPGLGLGGFHEETGNRNAVFRGKLKPLGLNSQGFRTVVEAASGEKEIVGAT